MAKVKVRERKTKKKIVKKAVSKSKKGVFKKKCADENAFILIDGRSLVSINELADALEKMSDDVFYYHVTPERNDFSNWIKDVFKIKDLGEKVSKGRNPLETEIIILKYFLN